MILVGVLTTNIITKNYCIYYYESEILCKVFFKCIFILISLFFVCQFKFLKKLKSIKNELPYILFTISITTYSFFHVSSLEVDNALISIFDNLLFLIYCIAVGMFEELFFRIFIFFFLLKILDKKKKRLIYSIILTSFIFGFSHLTNLLNPEFENISVINQILFAISIGIILQSIFIRTRSLILIICLHALINYHGSYKNHLYETTEILDAQSTFIDFITTFISIILFTVLIILPISYLLVKKNRNNNNIT